MANKKSNGKSNGGKVAAPVKAKKMFTRDEEHAILIRTLDKFLLTGFAFIGIGWYWLVTKVLYLNDLQQAIMFIGFGILSMTLILAMILKDYEFNRHYAKVK